MRRALAGTFALALGAGPLGVFLMLRRMSLVGDAMAHAILPGAAVGFPAVGAQPVRHDGGRADRRFRRGVADRPGRAHDRVEGGCRARDVLPALAGARRHHRLAEGHQHRSAARAVRQRAGARRPDAAADRRQCDHHAGGAGADLPPAGDRMRRSGLPALGQPGRRAGASRLPGAGGRQPGGRLPCARHAARGRHHDAAGRHRAVLGARHHGDDRHRDGRAARSPAVPGCCCLITPAWRPARRSSWWRARSMSSRCCSAASAGCCGRRFPGRHLEA